MSGEAGLEYFKIIIPDRPFVKTLALHIQHSSTTNSKQLNENQLLVSDPDNIQFLIRSQ